MLVRQTILASLAILCVTVAASAQTGIPTSTSTSVLPPGLKDTDVAATVNGEKLYVGEVRKVLEARPYPVKLKEEQEKQLRLAAVEVLIEDAIMRHYFNKEVPNINQADFAKEWRDFLSALEKKQEKLEDFMRKNGQTETVLKRDMLAKLQWKEILRKRYPEDKLKQYYDASKPFFDKVHVRASHILVKLPPNPTKAQVDEARQKLVVLRQEILAGKARFDDVAKKYSECPSKDKGGDIGEFPYKFVVVPEFARAAFSMNKNELSDIVQTVFGLHLILVTSRTAGEPSNFESLKETVREVWAQDEELYQRILYHQRKESDIKILLQ